MTNNDELALKMKAAAKQRIDADSWDSLDGRIARIGLYKDTAESLSPSNILALLAERDADKKLIAELQTICAESYQVVGALADAAGVFETSDAVSKALDNLSAAKLVHEDVLPFAVEARTVSVKLPENTPLAEAPEHIWLQTAGVWPENGEFSELTWCSDNQHRDDTLYVRADLAAGIKLDVGE